MQEGTFSRTIFARAKMFSQREVRWGGGGGEIFSWKEALKSSHVNLTLLLRLVSLFLYFFLSLPMPPLSSLEFANIIQSVCKMLIICRIIIFFLQCKIKLYRKNKTWTVLQSDMIILIHFYQCTIFGIKFWIKVRVYIYLHSWVMGTFVQNCLHVNSILSHVLQYFRQCSNIRWHLFLNIGDNMLYLPYLF
jgi:hypothetical protein